MKGMLKGTVVFGALVLAGLSTAQAQVGVSGGVGGGISIPTGSTADAVKLGWHGMALLRVKPAASPVGFQIDGQYQELKAEDAVTAFDKTQVINGTANVVFGFPVAAETRVRPYLIAGGGVYNLKNKVDGGTSSPSTTKFGINGGAGFDFVLPGATIFAEGRFHNVFVDGTDTKLIPVTVGVRIGR